MALTNADVERVAGYITHGGDSAGRAYPGVVKDGHIDQFNLEAVEKRLNAKLDKLQAAIGVGVQLTDTQAAALADKLAGALVARADNPLGDADKPVIISAVKEALREGTGA